MKVAVILTCYNRKEKTINCIRKLLQNQNVELSFVIVDDGSNDGTKKKLESIEFKKTIIEGNGKLFWAGGMRKGIDYFLSSQMDENYVLLVNDDVDFYPGSIDKMLEEAITYDSVIIGNCCDATGNQTYGAIKMNSIAYRPMYIHPGIKHTDSVDTFNCNAVLLKSDVVRIVGNFDPVYTHSLADYDYGFAIKKKGFKIKGSSFYVGVCNDNTVNNTWQDTSLNKTVRLKLKETPKGLPQKEWNHFLLKNLGVLYFLRYGYSAKLRILIGK